MKCPKCGEEVFDIYTTEQRIKDLYKANRTLGWVKSRLRILAEMYEDRLKLYGDGYGEPLNIKFIANNLREIHDKIETVK